MPGRIPAPNLSGGFHGILFDYIRKYVKPDDSLLLIAEPEEVIPVVREQITVPVEICVTSYSGEIGEKYQYDLNKLQGWKPKHDIILCQALLEHVCRPSVAIQNLVDLLNCGGYLVMHTHNQKMFYHAYPVDCCRFFKDFFVDLCKYLPIELVDYHEWDVNICLAYKKIKQD